MKKKWGILTGIFVVLFALTLAAQNGTSTPTSTPQPSPASSPENPPSPLIPTGSALLALTPTHNLVPSPNIPPPPPKPVYTYYSPVRDGFDFPQIELKKYPNLEVSGFHETKLSGRDYTPKVPSDSRFQTIRSDPFYDKLPRDVLVGAPKLDIRYKFNIDGKLDKELAVHYDIEQEQDFPGKYDIKVRYKDTRLTFYHFDTVLQDGELINIRKALNGAMIQSETADWETTVALGKLRSQPNKYEAFGSGTRVISLGARSILEDSLRVWVNNVPQNAGADFKIDYYKGEITFNSIKTATDYIVVIYEFTNPIEDFLPAVSRKNFMGAQFLWRSKFQPKIHLVSGHVTEELLKAEGATPNAEYLAQNPPVLISSEEVRLNGRILARNRDYFFKPSQGRVTLSPKVNFTKQDRLTMTYDFHATEAITETLIGQGSPGPYPLSAANVLEESVKVSVEDLPLTETKDFFVNYPEGKLQFNFEVAYGKRIDVQYVAVKTTLETATKNNAPLSLGVTYAKEFATSLQDATTVKVATESYQLTTSNILTTRFNPIAVSENMSVQINGVNVSSANFRIKNAYLGQIELLSPPARPYTVAVSYSYVKSYQTNYAFQLKTVNPDRNYRSPDSFQLRDLPVKYGGVTYIRRVTPTEQFLLTPGIDFTVQYGQDGQAIAIQFIIKSDPNSRTAFTEAPTPDDLLTLVYQYTPPTVAKQGTQVQEMVGLTATQRWNENLSSHAELVMAANNFAKNQSDVAVDLVGNGQSNTTYDLSRTNLVENSEAVYLNNRRVNRDSDYSINYAQGKIRFVSLTPGANDKIHVDFKVLDSSGSVGSTAQNSAIATKWSTQYQDASLTAKGDFKYIDRNFLPIGDFLENKGTTVVGGNVDWHPNVYSRTQADYHHRDTYAAGSVDTNKPLYLREDELQIAGDYKTLFENLDTKQSFHLLTQVQDADLSASTINAHAVDNLTWDYAGSLEYGPQTFRSSVTEGFSQKISDYIDKTNKTVITTQRTRLQNRTVLDKLVVLGTTSFTPYMELSNNQTDTTIPSVNPYVTTTYANRLDYGTTATALPWTFLPLKLDYNYSRINTKASATATENVAKITNATYEAGFNPIAWFSSSVSVRHAESETPLIAQTGSIEDARNYQVSRIGIGGLLGWTGLGLPWYLSPLRETTISLGRAETNRQENNAKRNYDYLANTYTVANIELIPGLVLRNYSYNDSMSNNLNTEGTFTASENRSAAQLYGKSGALGFAPKLPFLSLWSYTFGFDDRFSNIITTDLSRRSTSNRLTDNTPSYKRDQSLTFNPGNVEIPFIGLRLGNFSASAFENFNTHVNTKLTERFPSINTKTIASSTTLQDNSTIQSYGMDAKYSPLSLFNLGGSAKNTIEYYSRNTLDTTKGTTFKTGLEYHLNGDISPFLGINLTGAANSKQDEQYLGNDIGQTLEGLKLGRSNLSFAQLLSYLSRTQNDFTAGLSWAPWSFIALSGGGGVTLISQEYLIAASNTKSDITQRLANVGLKLFPFVGFSAGYVYTLKFTTDSSSSTLSKGYSGVTSVAYTPVETSGFKVNITYTREDTWGRDLNTLDRASTEQGQGNTIQTLIVDRSDTVETAVLSIDINLPFSHASSLLDRIVISGQGYLKRITDGLDDTKAVKRSYDLSGMILKGTMFF